MGGAGFRPTPVNQTVSAQYKPMEEWVSVCTNKSWSDSGNGEETQLDPEGPLYISPLPELDVEE